MTRFLDDILRQPAALASTVRFLGDGARRQLDAAVAALILRCGIIGAGP